MNFEIIRKQSESLLLTVCLQLTKENNKDLKHILDLNTLYFIVILRVVIGLRKIILMKSFIINSWQF